MSAPIGVALVGSGIFAQKEHLPAILSTPLLSLKAVYSRTLASASSLTSSLATKIDWYSEETAGEGRGYDDLLQNTNIKAVIIALPILTQPEFITKALKAGKFVLSEKPAGKDLTVAKSLLLEANVAEASRWSVAENWPWRPSYTLAREKVTELGRVLGFTARVQSFTKVGGKYFETAWRKTPEYQGGFLLDGGIHYVAAVRYMLGDSNEITRVSAYTHQLQEHLPPIDTVNAVLLTKTGVSGTFSVSFGTSAKGYGYSVACEHGTVTVTLGQVVVEKNGLEELFPIPDEDAGVKAEVLGWAQSIDKGDFDRRLAPIESVRNLALLEAMLRSGERNGEPVDVEVVNE